MDVGEKQTSLKITPITPYNKDTLGERIKWLKENLDLTITSNIQTAFQDKKAPKLYIFVLGFPLFLDFLESRFLDSYKNHFLFLICS